MQNEAIEQIDVFEAMEQLRLLKTRRARMAGGGSDFAELMLKDHFTGMPIRNAPMHKDWHEAIDNYQNVIIQAPRAHGKTEQAVVSRIIYELGMNPELRIKIIGNNDDKAGERIKSIREHIESNPAVHEVFPHLRPKRGREWSDHKLTVERTSLSKDPSIEARGVLSTATGGRADLLVADDPVDIRNAIQSPKLRENVIETFDNVWRNLLEPHGRIVFVSTPWHKADLTQHLIVQPDFFKVVHRIDLDGVDNPDRIVTASSFRREGVLWPQVWSRRALEARKRAGLRAFQRGYMLMPISDEEVMFGVELVARSTSPSLSYGSAIPRGYKIVVGVDLAATLSTRGAYTVIFVTAIDDRGRRFPIDIIRGRFTAPQTVGQIFSVWNRYHPELIGVENNAFQEFLVQHLRDQAPSMPVVGLHTGVQKMDLELGLPSVVVQFENGGWVIPSLEKPHTEGCTCGYHAWIDELESYPASANSDTLMAMWLSEQVARKIWAPNSASDRIISFDRQSPWIRQQLSDQESRANVTPVGAVAGFGEAPRYRR